MNRFTSVLWKESREAQPYLWVGLGLFLAMPMIGGLEPLVSGGHFVLETSPWVLSLGGVLAVLAGVGVTAGDLRPKVAEFWQSRPIGIGAWLAGKYAVALAAVLVACMVPLAAELLFARHPDDSDAAYLALLPFFWAAAFSLAVAAGCVVDRPAHAAVVGLVGLLLLYVLPVVVPPLAWLSVSDVGFGESWDYNHWTRHVAVFAAGLATVSAAAVAVSVVAVRRRWRVESGRRLLYALVAAAGLLLFTSAAFQLGTNLPVLQRIALPDDEWIRAIGIDGDHGYVLSEQSVRYRSGATGRFIDARSRFRTLAVGLAGLTLGPPGDLAPAAVDVIGGSAWGGASAGGFGYRWDARDVPGDGDVVDVVIQVAELRPNGASRLLPLWRTDRASAGLSLFVWADRLYAWGEGRLIVFDVTRPGDPRPTPVRPFHPIVPQHRYLEAGETRAVFQLVPLPGVPAAGRLAATLGGWRGIVGDLICERQLDGSDATVGLRLTTLTDTTATFDAIGRYRPTLLQRLNTGASWGGPIAEDGLVYLETYGSGRIVGGGVTVLDTRGPRPMREVGHFAVPQGIGSVHPLPDGRAVLGGDRVIYLLGPPPGWTSGK